MKPNKIKNLLKDPIVIAAYFAALIGLSLSNAAWNTWKIMQNASYMGQTFEYGLAYGSSIATMVFLTGILICVKIKKSKSTQTPGLEK
jgi:hypothetical protein